jgi:hypothetical protein
MEELALPRQEQLIQNTAFAEYDPRTNTSTGPTGDVRLGEALDFPADLVHVAGVAKVAFSAASLINFN